MKIRQQTQNLISEILVDGTRSEHNCQLWLATCKRYSFIQEFASEVLREKFLCMETELTSDYLWFPLYFLPEYHHKNYYDYKKR